MKKLLVLAAVTAMAMGAKAEYAAYDDGSFVNLYVCAQNADGDPVDAYPLGYNNFYVLTQNDLNTWEQNSGTLAELATASWMVGTAADMSQYACAVWNFYYDDAGFGTFTKVPKKNGSQVEVPFDPTKDVTDLIFVAANDEGDYYTANMQYSPSYYNTYGAMDSLNGWVTITVDSPSPVPEPTSGLLLLLGVAGLALKRKRA